MTVFVCFVLVLSGEPLGKNVSVVKTDTSLRGTREELSTKDFFFRDNSSIEGVGVIEDRGGLLGVEPLAITSRGPRKAMASCSRAEVMSGGGKGRRDI